MPVKKNTNAPKLCRICGAPIIGRHGKAEICWECHSMGNRARRPGQTDAAVLARAGFAGCVACAGCEKLACRHNPKNPARVLAE